MTKDTIQAAVECGLVEALLEREVLRQRLYDPVPGDEVRSILETVVLINDQITQLCQDWKRAIERSPTESTGSTYSSSGTGSMEYQG